MNADPQNAREMFVAAIKLPLEQWPAFLNEACRGDAVLRQRVEHLLAAHQESGSFLAPPAAGGVPTGPFDSSLADQADTAVPTEAAGTVIGPYKLLEQIG